MQIPRRPSITESEVYITAQGHRLQNDLYCVECDVKLYYTIPYLLPVLHCPNGDAFDFWLLLYFPVETLRIK